MSEVIWQPSPDRIAASRLTEFIARSPVPDGSYADLWEWSTSDLDGFWRSVWDFTGVIASQQSRVVLGSRSMPGAEWFPGARLNYAENLLRTADDRPAVIVVDESGHVDTVSRRELLGLVGRVQRSLLDLGVVAGDRVAGLVTNGLEAVVSMLAAASIGAIWSSCSPDFGPMGIIDRFGQIRPKVLITVDGYRYNGKAYNLRTTIESVVDALDDLLAVVVIPKIGVEPEIGDGSPIAWNTFVDGPPAEPVFAQLPFDHPLYVMYSSGTTGPPKSIVHGAGGTLLKHLSEHQLHSDIRRGDVVFWFTTCGWMMWNWLVSALASEAAIVVYDGSPSHPDLGSLWRMAADVGITHFGTSPRFLAANENAGFEPGDVADLSAVRWIGSTGAPLNPEQFDWVYRHVSADVQVASISGGTDIVGCFALGVPTLPVRRGELQGRALGMAVQAFDANGMSVVGEKAELVCVEPFPSMPVAFWDDPDGSRYQSAYFDAFPGVWTHGDFVEIRPEGGVVIYGRSDTTLNPGGVRIGTAEIYRAIEGMPGVDDAIVVGRSAGGDVEVVLCVQLAAGVSLDDDLEGQIKQRIKQRTSPRHVPRWVFAVADIPYTISGKKVEKAVALILAGEPVLNRDALANPSSLDEYVGLTFPAP